jgi:hypothetical protein
MPARGGSSSFEARTRAKWWKSFSIFWFIIIIMIFNQICPRFATGSYISDTAHVSAQRQQKADQRSHAVHRALDKRQCNGARSA